MTVSVAEPYLFFNIYIGTSLNLDCIIFSPQAVKFGAIRSPSNPLLNASNLSFPIYYGVYVILVAVALVLVVLLYADTTCSMVDALRSLNRLDWCRSYKLIMLFI